MERTPVERRIDEEGEVVDERVEERGDGLDGDDEMFEEAVDAQQLNSPIGNIELGENDDVGGGGRTPLADDGESVAAYDEVESFEEAVGTPTASASASSVDGGRSEDEILTIDADEKEREDVGAEKEPKSEVDDSIEKLQVAPQKVESLDEAIEGPPVTANVVDEGGTKEETEIQIPSNGGYEGHLEADTHEIVDAGVDEEEARDGIGELNEKLHMVSEEPESFEEAVSTPAAMASVVDEEWSKEENPPSNGHESQKEDDVKEIDGVDDSTEKLQMAFEEAIGTPTMIANVADEELTKEENPASEGHKEADLKEMEVGADEETKDGLDVPPGKAVIGYSEIVEISAEDGAKNYVEEAIHKAEVDGSGDVDLDGSSSGVVVQSEVSDSGDLKAVENHKDDETHHGKAELEAETNGHVNGELGSSDLAPHDADNVKDLKDEEPKDVSSISGTNHDSNGHVEAAAISRTKSNDGQNSVDHVKSPEIHSSTNSGEVANQKLEQIKHAVRSIDAAPVSKKKDDSNEKVNKAELPSLKPMNQAPAYPAGLGRAAPLLEPAPRAAAQQPRGGGGAVSQAQPQQIEETAANPEAEEHDETREKLQMIRVKFLRLAHRLGQTPHNVVVAQVLYRLGLAEQLRGRSGGRVGAFSFDRASAMAEQLEASGQDPLDFSCTIMVLGKSGVGKSATINSIFDEAKLSTDAFRSGTKKVQDVIGTVQGIKVRVIDTPGLLPSGSDQRHNEKILHSVKRFIKKTPPDIVLYLDRLDVQSIDLSDMPLLRTITDIFGASIWFNAIVVLTHAASAPPEGPNGVASSYDMFVTQRSHVVQQAIRQAAGDVRLMNPVSLVENHSACRTNRAGQRVLPNGQVWKPHLLLLSFASKILAEANTLLKLQDSPPGRGFATRPRMPPLPYLLSSLLQPRQQPRLPEEEDDAVEDDYDSSDSDEESEYDSLPPFKRLTKAQISKLSRAQKKAYFDELEYREKLFMKKQMKEARRQRRMMKMMGGAASVPEEAEEESGGAASVPVPIPDLSLPASFDSDNPTHRYRYLDTSNQWLVRPVLETHGWDHDVGYEGINVERLIAVRNKIPVSFSGQVTKDKKDANVQMELTTSIKHGEGKGTTLGFDMQTVGKDLAYSLRTDTKLANYRTNKAAAGLSLTLMNEAVTVGFKVEDKVVPSKWFRMVVTGGAITSHGDVAFGGSLDATVKEKDPLGRFQSTLGLSVMDWHGDLAVGGNLQSQIPLGRSTNLIARANLNNRGAGQVSVRVNSSEQLQIALVALVPLLKKMFDYCPRQLQFGFGKQ